MSLSSLEISNQEGLKLELQNERKATKLENLAAALLGRLLDIPISVAKSGFQHGGDAGSAGRQGRRFRIECKKYSDTTSLSDRELLGEIDQALSRDDSLEGWFLVATRSVSEQLEQDLTQKGERLGVPVVIIDWREHELAPLAALCSFAPDLVEAEFSKKAGDFARTLQPISSYAIEMLRRNLQSWCLGFEAIRSRSHEKLEKIWNSPRASNADLGQNAAGGAQQKKIRRASVHEALNIWWQGLAQTDAPVAITGWDGVGKTWATLDWLVDQKNNQPIVLVVPSSAVASHSCVSEISIKKFLAERLYEISGVRDLDHWLHRLDYLLMRPVSEGPVLTVFFDGLNQEPSVSWLSFLKVLQGEVFSGRVRVVISTRKHHFEDKLSMFRGLIVPIVQISVDTYGVEPGGELDQMLGFEGLTQADLHQDLIELARTPRLFALVVKFRDRLIEAGRITVHRLLWEYGRDTLGARSGRSFSEEEWRAWLKEIAKKYRDGNQEYSVKSLGETTNRPDLSGREVYARLSDIIDGQFTWTNQSGNLELTPTVVAHALGASLLAHLETVVVRTFETVNVELTQWLDPIAGLDQRAEILRAAVSILVERDGQALSPMSGVLVTAWLQTQNVTDSHRQELAVLAPNLTDALLDAVEQSDPYTHASARLWAVNALRAIPRTDFVALTALVKRLRQWFSIISRDIDQYPRANAEIEKNRADRFIRRIGIDASCSITVIGLKLELVDRKYGVPQSAAPSIIEGFPLAKVLPIFEAAAVALAVRDKADGWDQLKWLCLLNEVDSEEATVGLRQLSESVLHRKSEPGIHPDIPARVAALLLWLTGQEIDEDRANSIDPRINHWLSYEKDYLPNPSRSFFALERRHAEVVLNDREVPLFSRIQRTHELWFDPNFRPTESFISEVRATAAHIDVEKLNRYGSYTLEDRNFEELEPVLARCAPDILDDLIRRKMKCIATCPAESRYWSAIHVTNHFVLSEEAEAAAAKALRLSAKDADESRESYLTNQLLMVELKHLDAYTQLDSIIGANVESISTDFAEVLRPPTPRDVDALIAIYNVGTTKQQDDLLILLSIHSIEFSDIAWSWIEGYTKRTDPILCGIAFQALTNADAVRFGRVLANEGWCWSKDAHWWVNHYGSRALIEASYALPFDQIAPRLAPWKLLEAARMRGSDQAEVRLAAEIISRVILSEKIDAPDPGSILTVDQTENKSSPFVFSVSVRPNANESANPIAALEAAMDIDARLKDHRRAAETAVTRINEARAAGASLYLANVNAEDFKQVLQFAPDMVERWLEGASELTLDFRRRVHLADSAFLALCEALLVFDSLRGVQLWHALAEMVTVRYVGVAGVDDLLHMAFRAPDTSEVIALRESLVELAHSNTDQDLFDLAIAASNNGKAEWLANIIEKHRAATHVWRRKRSKVLSGFTSNNKLPIPAAWPDGEIKTDYASLEQQSARFRWIEACSHHWWRAYLAAENPVEAYSAWVLFLGSADRRAWTWMREDVDAKNDGSAFFELKLAHVQLNRSSLKRAMDKRTAKFGDNFLNRKTLDGIGPWGKESD